MSADDDATCSMSENSPEEAEAAPCRPEIVTIKMEVCEDERPFSDDYPSPVTPEEPWCPLPLDVEVSVKSEPIESQNVPIASDSSVSLSDSLPLVPPKRNYGGVRPGPSIKDLQVTFDSDGKYTCLICMKRFTFKQNILRHMVIHSTENIECELCHKKFLSKEQLQRHTRNKHYDEIVYDEKPIRCDLCGKIFKTEDLLTTHKKVHANEKYQCPICNKGFRAQPNFMKHQFQCRPRDITCNDCGEMFISMSRLKSHSKKHSEERPFQCEICQDTFKFKSTLERHKQIHSNTRPFACPICEKTFTSKGLLKPHMRMHSGERPFQCNLCLKRFSHKHNMNRHILRHDRVLHLECDICHKTFPKESRLKYHMRIHSDNRLPFKCEVCPKKYSHRQNIIRHYARKHPGVTYKEIITDASIATALWEKVVQERYKAHKAESILPDEDDEIIARNDEDSNSFVKPVDLDRIKNKIIIENSNVEIVDDKSKVFIKTVDKKPIDLDRMKKKRKFNVVENSNAVVNDETKVFFKTVDVVSITNMTNEADENSDHENSRVINDTEGILKTIDVVKIKNKNKERVAVRKNKFKNDFVEENVNATDYDKESFMRTVNVVRKKITIEKEDEQKTIIDKKHQNEVYENTDQNTIIDDKGQKEVLIDTFDAANILNTLTSNDNGKNKVANDVIANCGNNEKVENENLLKEVESKDEEDTESDSDDEFLSKYQRNKPPESAVSNQRYDEIVHAEKPIRREDLLTINKKTRAQNNYQCQICDIKFKGKDTFLNHQSRCMRKPCHICGKTFKNASHLKSHYNKHSEERPFQCEICPMKFKMRFTLNRHKKYHLNIKPFFCPICNKRVTSKGLLKAHMRKHSGEKPFQCNLCLKRFSFEHNRTRHQLGHDKVVNLECHICHKSYLIESRLKYHMRMHSNNKLPFKCNICPKKYCNKQNIMKHYARKHPEDTYEGKKTDAGIASACWKKVVQERFKVHKSDSILPDENEEIEDENNVVDRSVVDNSLFDNSVAGNDGKQFFIKPIALEHIKNKIENNADIENTSENYYDDEYGVVNDNINKNCVSSENVENENDVNEVEDIKGKVKDFKEDLGSDSDEGYLSKYQRNKNSV